MFMQLEAWMGPLAVMEMQLEPLSIQETDFIQTGLQQFLLAEVLLTATQVYGTPPRLVAKLVKILFGVLY